MVFSKRNIFLLVGCSFFVVPRFSIAAPQDDEASLKAYFDQVKAAHFAGDLQKKAKLTLRALPTRKDWSAVFTAQAMKRFHKKRYERDIGPFLKDARLLARLFRFRKEQSAYSIQKASTREIQTKKHRLPGGMNRIASGLKPGVVWYRLKFVKPGERLGMAYTALVFVHGRWVFFPKPWRYLDPR